MKSMTNSEPQVNDLTSLNNSSPEAKHILAAFAARQNIKKEDIVLKQFKARFTSIGLPIDEVVFNNVFQKLEEMGYGDIVFDKSQGAIFHPSQDIRNIGKKALGQPLLEEATPAVDVADKSSYDRSAAMKARWANGFTGNKERKRAGRPSGSRNKPAPKKASSKNEFDRSEHMRKIWRKKKRLGQPMGRQVAKKSSRKSVSTSSRRGRASKSTLARREYMRLYMQKYNRRKNVTPKTKVSGINKTALKQLQKLLKQLAA